MPLSNAPTGELENTGRYVEWTPVIAGAIAASALSFVLFTFGSSLGIALSSSSPTWRDASIALAILSGLYIILTTVASFGLGGYIAGRLRSRWAASQGADEDEIEFDGRKNPLSRGTAADRGRVRGDGRRSRGVGSCSLADKELACPPSSGRFIRRCRFACKEDRLPGIRPTVR